MIIIKVIALSKTYLFSKLLPLIFSPLGLVIVLLLFFIFRKKIQFIYYAILSLFIFSNGITSNFLLRFIEHPWQRLNIERIDKAFAIVVLSSGRKIPLGNTKIIEWDDPDRFFAGLELFKSGKGNKLIFTGGTNPYKSDLPPEGNIYLKEALEFGIPYENLLTTYPVQNTYQEAKAIRYLLDEKNLYKQKNIILVTSAFHMNRAKRIFEKEGFIVQSFPVDFKSNKNFKQILSNPLSWFPSSNNLYKSSLAIRELIGRIFYRIFM